MIPRRMRAVSYVSFSEMLLDERVTSARRGRLALRSGIGALSTLDRATHTPGVASRQATPPTICSSAPWASLRAGQSPPHPRQNKPQVRSVRCTTTAKTLPCVVASGAESGAAIGAEDVR
jgi:hypothetical protein